MNKFTIVFKQTFWQILGKVVTSIVTFLILSIVARTYGKENLGSFTLALTFLSMFMLICDFGFNGHLLRQIQNSKFKNQKEIFRKLLGTRIVWALILITTSIGLLPFLSFSGPLFIQLSIIGSLSILGSAIFTTSNLIFQKNFRYDLSSLATVIGYIVYFLLILFVSYKLYPPFWLSFSSMVGWLVIGVCSLFFVKNFISPFPIFDIKFSLNLLKKSWPIAATLVLNAIYFRADSFLIAFYKNISDVGIYNLAYQFFQAALVLPTFIMNAYYPILLKSFSGLKMAMLSLLGISLTGILLTQLFSPTLISIMVGGGFEGSVESLKILSLGFPAFFISSLLMWTLVAKGKYKEMVYLYTSGLILNLILNFIYIPKYSYIASSWITVISEYAILLLQLFFLRKLVYKRSL